MARNSRIQLMLIGVFAIGIGSVFSGIAYADDKDSTYSHQHITSSWEHDLVCGDHKCTLGETPKPPRVIPPLRGDA